MEIIEAIVIGIVQGLAEWLPISSEGINSLIMVNIFNKTFAEAVSIAIWLHFGTLLSATIYFRKDVVEIIKDIPKRTPLVMFLFWATLLTGIVGGTIYYFGVAELNIRGAVATAAIGVLLIITGLMQRMQKSTVHKKINIMDSIITGIAQGFAVLPGISRSGTTYSVLLLRKYKAEQALRLSFLMSIPAVLAAIIGMIISDPIIVSMEAITAVFFAFTTGLLTIKYFLKLAERINFSWFCICLGLLSFIPLFL